MAQASQFRFLLGPIAGCGRAGRGEKGVATADAVAESSAERWRFSGGRDSETASSGGTQLAPSERWRSGWDHEFESPLLQR